MRAFTPQEFLQTLHDLADMGHPEFLEAFRGMADGLVATIAEFNRAVRAGRTRNRIIARAGRHIGQKRRGSNGWR